MTCFFFGRGSLEECQDFVNDLNTKHIEYPLNNHFLFFSGIPQPQIGLSDWSIKTLFHKKTTTNSLLHYTIFHHRHLRYGIPMRQVTRVRRNCGSEEDFQSQAQELTKKICNKRISSQSHFPSFSKEQKTQHLLNY